MNEPLVSIIIVSYNRADDLRLSLEAVFASSHRNLEVIVVDNASADSAPDVAASFPGVKLIRNEENLGFAAANNLGLELARGDYIALVNNDAVIDERWVAELVTFLDARPDAAAAGGKQYFWNDENPLRDRRNRYWGYIRLKPDGNAPSVVNAPDAIREVPLLSGCAVMIRRAAIEAVGTPFLEPMFFMYYEESDFFARAIKHGFRLFYVAAAECWHRQKAGLAKEPYRYHYYMHRNRLLFAYRNYDDPELRTVVDIARQRARNARRARRLTFGLLGSDQGRAALDAFDWAEQNQALLLEQRARHASVGRSYNEAIRALEGRANYYGHARPEVAELVPEDALCVIDVGCGAGSLGRSLKEMHPGRQVRGIEPVAEAAALARNVLDDVFVGSVEDPLPSHWPRPDCVIFADVLEHLTDPWGVLKKWRDVLAPGGAVVISIPNVVHHSVLRGLARGAWDYESHGILDRTHLRFFTRKTVIELVEQAGFRLERLRRVEKPPGGPLKPFVARALARTRAFETAPSRLRASRATLADIGTFQYLLLAR